MNVRIESDYKLPPGAETWIELRVRLTFSRYTQRVRQIRVLLQWLPAPAGTVVVACRGSRAIVSTMTGSDPLGSLSDLLERAARQLDRKLRLARALTGVEVH